MRGSLLAMLATLLLGGACYNPDFSRVLYKCSPSGTCPDGLMCLDGKHCTSSAPACTKGGIMIAADTYVCPGDQNNCKAGYKSCSATMSSTLCNLDVSDMMMKEGCTICCAGSDM